MKPDWFIRARKKWAAEMVEARKRCAYVKKVPVRNTYAAFAERKMNDLRAQALALVLIDRASR